MNKEIKEYFDSIYALLLKYYDYVNHPLEMERDKSFCEYDKLARELLYDEAVRIQWTHGKAWSMLQKSIYDIYELHYKPRGSY